MMAAAWCISNPAVTAKKNVFLSKAIGTFSSYYCMDAMWSQFYIRASVCEAVKAL